MILVIIACYFIPVVSEPLTLTSPEFQRILEEPEPVYEPPSDDIKPIFDPPMPLCDVFGDC